MNLYDKLAKLDKVVESLNDLLQELQPCIDELREKTSPDSLRWIQLGNLQYKIDYTLEYVERMKKS